MIDTLQECRKRREPSGRKTAQVDAVTLYRARIDEFVNQYIECPAGIFGRFEFVTRKRPPVLDGDDDSFSHRGRGNEKIRGSFIKIFILKYPLRYKGRDIKMIIASGYNIKSSNMKDFYSVMNRLLNPDEVKEILKKYKYNKK